MVKTLVHGSKSLNNNNSEAYHFCVILSLTADVFRSAILSFCLNCFFLDIVFHLAAYSYQNDFRAGYILICLSQNTVNRHDEMEREIECVCVCVHASVRARKKAKLDQILVRR